MDNEIARNIGMEQPIKLLGVERVKETILLYCRRADIFELLYPLFFPALQIVKLQEIILTVE